MTVKTEKLSFEGASGEALAARPDLPAGTVRAYALFAHCFTCTKDIFAAQRIAGALTGRGIAVLRFDLTGLGHSGGESPTPPSPPTSATWSRRPIICARPGRAASAGSTGV